MVTHYLGGTTFALAAAVVFLPSCDSTTQPPPPAGDTVPPYVQVIFPTSPTEYDEDGDHLLDLTVTWGDSGTGLDLTTAAVTATPGVNGLSGAGNLLPGWHVEILDSTRLGVHETLQNLLRGGLTQLQIAIRDRAGNTALAQVAVDLPYATYLKTIQTGLLEGPDMRLTICPDDDRLYGTAGWNLVVADADALTLLDIYPHQGAERLFVPLCVPGDSVLYVTERVERFNRNTMAWMSSVTGSFGSRGITQSRANPAILYVGESFVGGVAVADRILNQRIGSLALPPAGNYPNDYVFELIPSDGDSRLYISRTGDGILIADTLGTVHATVPVWEPQVLRLSPDQSRLYAVDYHGLWEVERTGAWYHLQVAPPYAALYFDLSPSGERAFITTRDDESDSLAVNLGYELLVDVTTWQVLATFPHPQLGWHGGVAFHPNGKLIFAARNFDIDVFLNRE
jgi:hypothetical protein